MKYAVHNRNIICAGMNMVFPLFSTKFIKRHHLLLACMPKSGSTFLSTVIENLPGMQRCHLVPAYDRREQELDVFMCYCNQHKNYIAQHHVRYSKALAGCMTSFGIYPIVLVRDIFDVVVSLRDHFQKSVIGSMAYVPRQIPEWNDYKAFHFIADMFVPWYLNFYLSWNDCDNKILLTYNQILNDPTSVLMHISQHYNLPFSRESLINAINAANKQDTRKNVSITGRGNELSDDLKMKIRSMAEYYEGVDFSPIGL